MIATLSAGFNALLTYNLLQNLKSREKLESVRNALPGVIEDLTLAIPARNEERNLGVLLAQILDQMQKPRSVLVLDDNSTDSTAQVVTDFSKKYGGIKLISGEPLPSGWRGKVWALEQLTRKCETKWILFIDADVRFLDSWSLASLWDAYSRRGRQGLASVFPKLKGGDSAHLLLDQVYTHLYYFLPYIRHQTPIRGAVAATGQVMLVAKSSLEELNAWGRIRSTTHDGLQLARIFDQARMSVFAFDGVKQFECLMYSDFVEAFKGFSRNSFEALGSRVGVTAIAGILLWGFVLPYVLWPFFMANPFWLVSFLYFLYGQYKLAESFDLGWSHMLLSPVKSLSSVGVHLWGMARKDLGLGIEWKGREV